MFYFEAWKLNCDYLLARVSDASHRTNSLGLVNLKTHRHRVTEISLKPASMRKRISSQCSVIFTGCEGSGYTQLLSSKPWWSEWSDRSEQIVLTSHRLLEPDKEKLWLMVLVMSNMKRWRKGADIQHTVVRSHCLRRGAWAASSSAMPATPRDQLPFNPISPASIPPVPPSHSLPSLPPLLLLLTLLSFMVPASVWSDSVMKRGGMGWWGCLWQSDILSWYQRVEDE